jgi:hypothetical protein
MSAIRWAFVIIGLIIGSIVFGWSLGGLYGTSMPANSTNNVGSENIVSKQETTNETEMKTGGSSEITQVTPNVATNLGINTSKENTTASTEKTTLSAEVKESHTNMAAKGYSSQTVEPTQGLAFNYSNGTRP